MGWLRRWVPRPGARLRLLCFPCAAGSAVAYRTWAGRLPEHIEVLGVELPGHGDRRGEPLLRSVTDVIDGLLDECCELLRRPVAVHGHSMGALLALEFARGMRRLTGHPPAALLVASCEAPADRGQGGRWVPALANGHARDLLRDLGGIGPQVLSDERMMSELMPVLHADVELMDAYRPGPAAPLRCPVRVYAGTAESGLSPAGLTAWRRENPADFLLSRLPGGHFFLRDNEPLYLARIARDLTGTQQNGAVRWTPSNS
jgi:pyochelin biosynthesis protein PchC